jgi:hypothetical protein
MDQARDRCVLAEVNDVLLRVEVEDRTDLLMELKRLLGSLRMTLDLSSCTAKEGMEARCGSWAVETNRGGNSAEQGKWIY